MSHQKKERLVGVIRDKSHIFCYFWEKVVKLHVLQFDDCDLVCLYDDENEIFGKPDKAKEDKKTRKLQLIFSIYFNFS